VRNVLNRVMLLLRSKLLLYSKLLMLLLLLLVLQSVLALELLLLLYYWLLLLDYGCRLSNINRWNFSGFVVAKIGSESGIIHAANWWISCPRNNKNLVKVTFQHC
jgi:hypothetical protein